MKQLLLMATLLLTTNVTAADTPSEQFMSLEQQNAKLKTIAKEIRKKLWQSGHEDVGSYTTFVTKALLDQNVASETKYESYLERDEVAQLYQCYYNKSCELYLIVSSGSIWSGYGETAHYILLYTKSGKSFELSHIIYEE